MAEQNKCKKTSHRKDYSTAVIRTERNARIRKARHCTKADEHQDKLTERGIAGLPARGSARNERRREKQMAYAMKHGLEWTIPMRDVYPEQVANPNNV